MSNKKQTAVEWLVQQVNSDCLNSSFIRIELVKEAKEMEKDQIIDAYEQGFDDACDDANEMMPQYTGAEQYYNENYGGKNERG